MPPGIIDRKSHVGSSDIRTMIRRLFSIARACLSIMIPGMKPLVSSIALVLAVATLSPSAQSKRAAAPAARQPFTVVEATIPAMRAAMEQGRITSRDLVEQYLVRIATYEDRLHAAITVNPQALAI